MSDVETPISLVELRLAARNHAMPLEALRYAITPAGLHYLLMHYDIPAVDEATYRLEVDGLVATPLSLSLDELRARPAVELAVTMECAGNGRALIDRARQPAVAAGGRGHGRWRGTPLRALLSEAGVADDAVELVFTGLDHGLEGGDRAGVPAQPLAHGRASPEVLLAYEMNGAPLAPQHGFPLRLLVPGWYGMTSVKWLGRITAVDRPFEGYQQSRGYRLRQEEDEEGEPVSRMLPRALMVPPGFPGVPDARAARPRRVVPARGRAWSGRGDRSGRGQRPTAAPPGPPPSWRTTSARRGRGSAWTFHWRRRRRASTSCAAARATPRERAAARAPRGTSAATRTTPSSGSLSP